MDITIRQATLLDLEKLTEWRMEVLRTVFAIPRMEDINKLRSSNIAYYEEALQAGSHIAVFAESAGSTVGCGGLCLYREMPSPDNPTGQCAYLMNIYTRELFRGNGVARAIVNYLVDYAKKLNIQKIYLEASACGRPLYQGLGFEDMNGYMKLP